MKSYNISIIFFLIIGLIGIIFILRSKKDYDELLNENIYACKSTTYLEGIGYCLLIVSFVAIMSIFLLKTMIINREAILEGNKLKILSKSVSKSVSLLKTNAPKALDQSVSLLKSNAPKILEESVSLLKSNAPKVLNIAKSIL